MDTAPALAVALPGSAFITTDFLLKALRENTDHIVKSFTTNLGALSQRVDMNTVKLDENTKVLDRHESDIQKQRMDMDVLSSRVSELERAGPNRGTVGIPTRADLSEAYMTARRSMRLWPIVGENDDEVWEAVGIFIHDTLKIDERDVNQGDIESISRVESGGQPDRVRDEVLVTMYDRRVRDVIVTSSPNLANCVDHEGRPNAGIRLEIPPELMDTFRLLSRFGTRLRARHGNGTKKNIKFDDYLGSLYTNVKLPGDEAWTRVTPDMAREDLEASVKEENSFHKKRMAAKLVPGPRDRLRVPPSSLLAAASTSTITRSRDIARIPATATAPVLPGRVAAGEGRRPRWKAPIQPGRLQL